MVMSSSARTWSVLAGFPSVKVLQGPCPGTAVPVPTRESVGGSVRLFVSGVQLAAPGAVHSAEPLQAADGLEELCGYAVLERRCEDQTSQGVHYITSPEEVFQRAFGRRCSLRP